METVKQSSLRFLLVALLVSVACCMAVGAVCAQASVAMANPVVNVQATLPNGADLDQDVDLATVANTSAVPVVGMYYKSDQWNVLATGTAAGQYATFEAVVTKALQQHATTGEEYTFAQVWNSSTQTFSLTTTDGTTSSAYTKYYPTYADTVSRTYFYDLVTNSVTTLTSGLRSSSYLLLSTTTPALYGANPNGAGAVFAWWYGSDKATGTETAGAAAQRAAASVSSHTYPRLIMGCEDGMGTTDAMGKRYPYDIVGVTF